VARLPVISGSECIAVLRRFGYEAVRTRGSHVRLRAPGRRPLTVPLHRELDRGTLSEILRTAGVSVRAFFEEMRR
jgi:predicted RNA binding protein YcfA (HicA-like mRNA interferase family)